MLTPGRSRPAQEPAEEDKHCEHVATQAHPRRQLTLWPVRPSSLRIVSAMTVFVKDTLMMKKNRPVQVTVVCIPCLERIQRLINHCSR